MAIPDSRILLKEWCLRKLGKPVIEINVDDDQLEDRIDEGLQFFQEYHFDGVEKVYEKHQMTQTDINNQFINMDDIGIVPSSRKISSMTKLTHGGSGLNSANNYNRGATFPEFSPDGTQIAFSSAHNGANNTVTYTDIYKASYNSATKTIGPLTRLTNGFEDGESFPGSSKTTNSISGRPAWSPDGNKIAYQTDRLGTTNQSGVGTQYQIYMMDATDGENKQQITQQYAGGSFYDQDLRPTWNHNGSRIAFTRSVDAGNHKNDIYYVSDNGWGSAQDATPLIENVDIADAAPSYSPDGNKIAWESTRDSSDPTDYAQSDIYIANADGTNQIRLTNKAGRDSYPQFSPDSTKILWSHSTDDSENTGAQIHIMDVDGSNQQVLSVDSGNYLRATWHPSGNQIAFSSSKDGYYEIWVVDYVEDAGTTYPINKSQDAYTGVSKIFPLTGSGIGMWDIRYQMRLSDLTTFGTYLGGYDLLSYEMRMKNLSMIQELLMGKIPIRFNRHKNRLYLDWQWNIDAIAGEFIIIEAFKVINPETFPDIYNDMFLKQYITALFKEQWGLNLSKFEGVQMPGGVTLNGRAILDEARTDLEKLREEMSLRYELPIDMMMA